MDFEKDLAFGILCGIPKGSRKEEGEEEVWLVEVEEGEEATRLATEAYLCPGRDGAICPFHFSGDGAMVMWPHMSYILQVLYHLQYSNLMAAVAFI